MLLAGDIGGTKTVLALYNAHQSLRHPIYQKRYRSADYASLKDIIADFLASKLDPQIEAAAFGVAGPIVNGTATLTNLSWVETETELSQRFNIPKVALINDLEAIANAIPILEETDTITLNKGQRIPQTSIAVIAPGTGLGEAYLTWDGTQYRPYPSEGGHADFSPSNAEELGLLNFLYQQYDHVSTERVCSGMGIPNIYDYLKSSGYAEESPWLAESLSKAADRTPIISTAAADDTRPCPLCVKTMEMFVSILGAEAGDLALTFLATGGVYLSGGIPPRIIHWLKSEHFLERFFNKGRFEGLMRNIPLEVIDLPGVALLGAARAGQQLLKR